MFALPRVCLEAVLACERFLVSMDTLMANAMFTALEGLGAVLAFVFTARSATVGDGDGDGLVGVQGHPGGLDERARC